MQTSWFTETLRSRPRSRRLDGLGQGDEGGGPDDHRRPPPCQGEDARGHVHGAHRAVRSPRDRAHRPAGERRRRHVRPRRGGAPSRGPSTPPRSRRGSRSAFPTTSSPGSTCRANAEGISTNTWIVAIPRVCRRSRLTPHAHATAGSRASATPDQEDSCRPSPPRQDARRRQQPARRRRGPRRRAAGTTTVELMPHGADGDARRRRDDGHVHRGRRRLRRHGDASRASGRSRGGAAASTSRSPPRRAPTSSSAPTARSAALLSLTRGGGGEIRLRGTVGDVDVALAER